MARPPTSHDVARLAGVSQPTVSRALRDDPRVAAETRRRVREAAAQLTYVPSRRGRSLATRATGQIGVVVGELGNPFYMEAVEHLHTTLDRAGRRMVVLTDFPGGPVSTDVLLDGSIDGAILTTTTLGSSRPRELAARGLPCVLLNRSIDEADVDWCVSANASGARAVGEEMLRLGHTLIGAILGPAATSTGRDREAGFRSALASGGAPLDDRFVHTGPFAYATGHAGLLALMATAEPPTAVFCANDAIAIGALNAASALGVAVPDRLTIFGYDDIGMADWDVFRLSTVRQDLAAMAAAAVDLLLERIADPARPPQQLTVPSDLVLRGSHAGPQA